MSIRIKILLLSAIISVATLIFCFSVGSSSQPQQSSSKFSNSTTTYILKEFNGMLAIYEKDNHTPIEILDVDISTLPERDIEKIKKGILADSLNEIVSLAEDYE